MGGYGMRMFKIDSDGNFNEFVRTPFQAEHQEIILEKWLETNPDGIVEDGKLLVIGRQVPTNLGGFVDLLALDEVGNTVVIELKRDRTPRDTVAQALEYASSVEQLNLRELERILQTYLQDEALSLADYHRQFFELTPNDAVAFNKDQRIVVVGQNITSEIRQTAVFLRSKGIGVSCLEFSFFQSTEGAKLLSQEIVVGREPVKSRSVSSASMPSVTQNEFMASLTENGKPVFERLLQFARDKSMPIHWGTKGFSMNEDINGNHVPISFGYPPNSVFKQSIYTGFYGRGGLTFKTAIPGEILQSLLNEVESTGLFQPAGRDLKCIIDRHFTEEETSAILSWCERASAEIRKYGLKGEASPQPEE